MQLTDVLEYLQRREKKREALTLCHARMAPAVAAAKVMSPVRSRATAYSKIKIRS